MVSRKEDKRADPLHYLSPEAITTLANLLNCEATSDEDTHIPNDWLTQQRVQIESIPDTFKLKRHLSLATFFTVDKVLSGRLCHYHHDLKPELMFWCFTKLNDEVSIHLDRFRRYRRNFPKECTDELRAFIDRVTAIATLFMSNEAFNDEYGKYAIPDDMRYDRVRHGCAACVLSVVGVRAQMLVDLRASMLARTKGKAPRLLTLIEAWMYQFGSGRLEMRLESEEAAEELRRLRRRIHSLKGSKEAEKEKHYQERDRETRRRKQKKKNAHSFATAFASFLGIKFDDRTKKEKEKAKERRGSHSSGGHRHSSSASAYSSSSSHHGSSTSVHSSHRDSRAGSTHSTHSSSSRRSSASTVRPSSRHSETHSSRPTSSHSNHSSSSPSRIEAWADDVSEAYSYYDPDLIVDQDDARSVRSARRSSHHTVSPCSSTTGSAHPDDVSSISSSSRYSRNPYRQSIPSVAPPIYKSSESVHTIRPNNPPATTSQRNLHPVFDPNPGDKRHTWTSAVASSVYSTDNAGLHAGDSGFRAHGNGYAVRGGGSPTGRGAARDPDLQTVVESLALEDGDVPLHPDSYDEVYCPSESEDGDDEGEYVPARKSWKADEKKKADEKETTTKLCPVCGGTLAGLSEADANAHVNACLDSQPGAKPVKKNAMVDEVINDFGGLAVNERARPRSSQSSRSSRGYRSSEPSDVGVGVRDSTVMPDDSISSYGVPGESGSNRRQSKLGGGKFRGVVRGR